MNRDQKIQFLKNVESGIISISGHPSDIQLQDYIIIKSGRGKYEVDINDSTTIHPEIEGQFKKDMVDFGGTPPPTLCHIENNQIRLFSIGTSSRAKQ